MTISSDHPFATPADQRSALRRLRGRLTSGVSVWTSSAGTAGPGATGPAQPGEWAGLTVSSFVVADGTPGAVVGLIDPDSDLADLAQVTGRMAVSLLTWRHRDVADVLAGLAPSPGGPFRTGRWQGTDWGPVLSDAPAWVGGAVVPASTRDVGWSRLVELSVEHIHIAESAGAPAGDAGSDDGAGAGAGAGSEPLVHRHGRYLRLPSA